MSPEKYDELWKNLILPCFNSLIKRYPSLQFNESGLKQKISQEYAHRRKYVHGLMQDAKGRIDRHKVAAAFTFIIIKLSPITASILRTDPNWPIYKLINEAAAIGIAFGIVKDFIISQAKQSGNNNFDEIYAQGFRMPECDHNKKYVLHLYRLLYNERREEKEPILFLAHILFLIEKYTEYCLNVENKEKI